IGLMGMVYSINFVNFWIQRRFANNLKALLPFIIGCLVLVGLEYFGIYSVSKLFGSFFNLVLTYPLVGLIPLILLFLSYKLTFNDVKANLYLDAYLDSKQKTYQASDLSWSNKFGALAPFIQLDLKLLWRNKRAKTTVYLSLGILAYVLLVYTNPKYADFRMLIFVGVFIIGIFIINVRQFIPPSESSYFCLFQTRSVTMKHYLESGDMLMDGS